MAKFRQPPNSVAEATIISKSITANGTYNASADSADGYNPVTVAVPIKTIVSKSITANGTYNASADSADGYNPVTVNVPAHNTLSGTTDPTSLQGDNGDTYIKYTDNVSFNMSYSVTGGYNGGAVLVCTCNNTEIIRAIGTSPYNLDYDIKTGSYTYCGKELTIEIIPPANNTSALVINWYLDSTLVWTNNIMPNGANTSYGYNSTGSQTETVTPAAGHHIITDILYKSSGVWLHAGDDIII